MKKSGIKPGSIQAGHKTRSKPASDSSCMIYGKPMKMGDTRRGAAPSSQKPGYGHRTA